MFLAEALRCEHALDGERLCGERGRLRGADTAFGGVILRIFSGRAPTRVGEHGILARSGRYEVLAKTS